MIWWLVGGAAGAVVGFGAYAITHRDNFQWGEAALWTGGGAFIGGTLGAGAQMIAGTGLFNAGTSAAGMSAATGAAGKALNFPTAQQVLQAASRIEVAGPKLDYLLQIQGKMEGFKALGFTPSNIEALRQTLVSLGQTATQNGGELTEYGMKFRQAIEMVGPNGALGRLTTVWQIDNGTDVLRFITAWVEVFTQ